MLTSSVVKKHTMGRWLYILVLLAVMHVLLDARYRIVLMFPTRAFGFAVLAAAYLAISILLTSGIPFFLRGLFSNFNIAIQKRVSPLLQGGPRRNAMIICVLVVLMTIMGCYLRWLFIKSIPIAPIYADMLPLIQGVCEAFTSGENPYAKMYYFPWELPLTYWPGLWMPYLLPHVLGVEFRLVHLAVVVIISLLFAGFIWKAATAVKGHPETTVYIAAFSSLFLFLFSSEFIIFANIAHTPPYWLWLALLSTAVLMKRPWLSAIFLGLALSTRQPALIYVPIIAIYWLRTFKDTRKTLYLSALTALSYLLICSPFILLDPHAFFLKPLQAYTQVGWDFARGHSSFMANTIGFSFLIRSIEARWLPQIMNVLAVIITWIMAWKRLSTETDALLYLGFVGIAFTLTVSIPFHYEYMPLLIVISFASIAAAIEENKIRIA